MDFTNITKNLIEDVSAIFSQSLTEKSLEKQFQELDIDKKYDIVNESIQLRIHGINWKSNVLKTLNEDGVRLPTGNSLAEWFVIHLHKLLCSPLEVSSIKIIHRLPYYPPSECVLQALKDDNSLTDLKIANPTFREYVATRKLDASNIHQIFGVLLELEDVANLQEYVPLIQRNVTLKKHSNRRYSAQYNQCAPGNIKDILTPHMDLVVVVSTKESASLNLKFDVTSIKLLISEMNIMGNPTAVIKDVGNSSVLFSFDDPTKLNESSTYDLIFFSMRFPIRYQHRALELLAANNQMREYLFPKNNPMMASSYPRNTHLELINLEIGKNPEQLQAVRHISSGPNPHAPYIIFGPPGTGKTTTIVESILQLRLQRPESRILVTAGSNSACNTIALRICQYFKSSPRLREHLSSTDALPILRIFSKSVQKRGVEIIPDELLKHSNITWKCGKHAYPAVEDIHKYGIVVVTLCTVGKLVCADVNVNNYFTHIFIDEAAASTEPETLVGIMGIKRESNEHCRVILSGDHKQLGPVLKSVYAVKFGLNMSLMQRLLNNKCYAVDENGNYDRTLQTRLRRNYRSHKEIVSLFNNLYYNNELLAMHTKDMKFQRKWSFLPSTNYPIVFQAVHGVTAKEDSMSSCNMLEIEVLIWYIKRLINVDSVKQTDIGVIAPYKLQCQHIRNRLNNQGWKYVEVGSVEIFQGREKQVIIASMVRSFTNLGFLHSPQRLNVLLSRAKSLLIIMGNPVSLRYINGINFVIEKCKENGTYLRKKKE